ncbi:MAG: hypothetical protein IPM82_17755 [Saprospiraceae bacterium]|nr:hypothetical protein [Saprospiraceae bacterium]
MAANSNSHIILKTSPPARRKTSFGKQTIGLHDLDPKFSPNGAWSFFWRRAIPPNSPKNITLMNAAGAGRLLMFGGAEMVDWK